ncbi:MAG TPA: SusD/RagB family nutrient-binding outer membrane lipoprotein [Flavisolibacter sp.]|jgi:hypothetical protein|nr:SusD/RagB family nutrient-binding outer membrane lipoprotein [Flavisolibacter sp.]
MKKFIIYFSITVLAGIVFSGCKKSEFSGFYYNPERAVTADIPRLYAGLFYNEKILPRYWNLYTFQIPVMGTYSQTAGYTNGKGVYEQPTNYTGNRWDYFYESTIARYREIEKYYNGLTSDAEKAGYQLFLETARIFLYDQTTQMVDMWGDIPFSTAGSLNAEGRIVLASYDKAEDIYNKALTELKRISDYLTTVSPSAFYLNQLKAYDYVNAGDLMKWRKYANSLILRIAMRTSYKNEAAAKSLVQTILGNATQYPLVNAASESIVIQPNSPTSTLAPADQNEIRNGFDVAPYAPGKMVNDIMLPSADPRLPVYFTKNASGTYKGIYNTLTEVQVTAGITSGDFSRWDSTTFSENHLLPGILVTAAEVSFLKAEAYERWGGGSAQTAYETGIRQSIAFWYAINNNSDRAATKDTPPTEAQIVAFLANPIVAYGTNNLQKIATQKWIDYTVLRANEAWAEWRRTKLPALTFPTDNASTAAPNVPTRLLYPASESTLNTANYATVQSADKATTKIFWDVK